MRVLKPFFPQVPTKQKFVTSLHTWNLPATSGQDQEMVEPDTVPKYTKQALSSDSVHQTRVRGGRPEYHAFTGLLRVNGECGTFLASGLASARRLTIRRRQLPLCA